MCTLWKLQSLYKTKIETKKKTHHVFELNQSQWLQTHIEINKQKRIEAWKNNDKDGNALWKLINNTLYIRKNNGKI